ncbi:uncharacterized protein PG986_001139 [Apiospora aurea]|uniref:Prolyl 4-hydroxylase alpha subunit Fe(2+) 2OG dioxygenase domain-containing protein n=1 Tax=Apiospora aurea TaxID=335848 RepID=A0ABR1QVZ0_9PEZI
MQEQTPHTSSPDSTPHVGGKSLLSDAKREYSVKTNWSTFVDQQMTGHTASQLLSNQIPVVRAKGFLTPEECEKMLAILKTHEIVSMGVEVSSRDQAGDADHVCPDKTRYFHDVSKARSLQHRWKTEAGIDILERVAGKVQEVTGVPTRVAKKGDKEYFAGLVRAADKGISIHADWKPYVKFDCHQCEASVAAVAQEENHGSGAGTTQSSKGWTVTNIAAQLSWNIVLNPVYGGETIIYDRVWDAPADEQAWQKEIDFDTYHKKMLEGRPFKVMLPVPGGLAFFNTRNFHEVLPCDTSRKHPVPETRYTVSSFIGYKPPRDETDPGALVLWS